MLRRFAFTIASLLVLSSAFSAAFPGSFSIESIVDLAPQHHGARSGYIVASS